MTANHATKIEPDVENCQPCHQPEDDGINYLIKEWGIEDKNSEYERHHIKFPRSAIETLVEKALKSEILDAEVTAEGTHVHKYSYDGRFGDATTKAEVTLRHTYN